MVNNLHPNGWLVIVMATIILQVHHHYKTKSDGKTYETPKLRQILKQPGKNEHSILSPLKQQLRGKNFFFHEITSGTCASNGFRSIISHTICTEAARLYGNNLTHLVQHSDQIYECSSHSSSKDDVVVDRVERRKYDQKNIQCTTNTPCFCTTHYFVDHGNDQAHRKNAEANGQFIVTWDLSLGGQEDLLNNAFLKTGFEQSVKDYINNDILCSDDLDVKGAEFFGVQIPDNEEGLQRKWRSVSGNGKCRGKPQKCKKPLDLSALESEITDDDDDRWSMKDTSRVVKVFHNDDEFCEVFLQSTIFDAFKERLQVASKFNYNVDVGVIVALEGALELKYEVSFEPDSAGLDQIESVGAVPKEPIPADTVCSASQCLTQRAVMRSIFQYFDLPWDESKHECLYQGINCNMENMVTNIWLINNGADSAGKRFAGKTIPDFFGSLPSLEGLFLGGNQLVGSIPSSFGLLRNLNLLWLEDNNLTGSLPTQLGNLRRLIEFNINGNNLTGIIPSEIQKLKRLRMLNIGKNTLAGPINNLILRKSETNIDSTSGCSSFPNPFVKMTLNWIGQEKSPEDNLFESLITLVLEGNSFTGTIPTDIFSFPSLEDLNLANNGLTGTIPKELGSLQRFRVFDLRGNSLTGTIPKEVGQLRQLKIFNIYGNELKGTIPTDFGKLTSLTELVLDNNLLNGEVPSEIGDLSKLTHLTFSGNRMKGDIPSELGNLVSLKHLDLRGFSFGKIDDENDDDIDGNTTIIENDDIDVNTGAPFMSLVTMKPSTKPTWSPSKIPSVYPSGVPSISQVPSSSKFPSFHPSSAPSLQPNNDNIGGKNGNNKNGNDDNNKKHKNRKKKSTATIPTELGKLEKWKYVVFENNGVTGSIPTEFGNLKSTGALWLKDEQVSGPIPEELGKLEKLTVLGTGNNQLEGSMPSTLGNITSLEYLEIGGNSLTDEVPTELGNLTNLKYIAMGDQNITGALPSELGNMASLEYLYLQNSELTGSLPTELGNLANLKAFSASGCAVGGSIPTQLGNLNQLTEINFAENSFTGTIPTELGQLQSALSIDLTSNKLTGNIPSELASITTLEKLLLCDNDLTGSIPSEFAFLTALQEIDLCDNELTGTIPSDIGLGSSRIQANDRRSGLLQIINLGSNALSGVIPSDFRHHSGLTRIMIDENSITGTIPTELGNLQSLLSLSVVGNRLIGSVPSELGAISTLFDINIGGNLLTGSIPSELQSKENLLYLNISRNAITGDLYFMCDLNSFEINDDSTIDCNNYCGTVDEECSGTSIGDAVCLDVGCSGSGVPSCTDECKLDYSSCLAGSNEMIFQLDLTTDSNGWQTSWQITDNTGMTLWEMEERSYRNSASMTEIRCLETACYTFELFDSGGDGICCGENIDDRGSYVVFVDDVSVPWTKLSFEASASHSIGSCTGAPFPSTVSMEPTSYPTGLPSVLPSVYPTLYPSVEPTSASDRPSIYPTLSPTLYSSVEPTSASDRPSIYPTLSPTLYSSIEPTSASDRPSIYPTLSPTLYPSIEPTSASDRPSIYPTLSPSSEPSVQTTFILSQFAKANGNMGYRVAIDQDMAFSCRPFSDFGQAYRYNLDGTLNKVYSRKNSGDRYGSGIAIEGDYIVIGAWGVGSKTGRVYIWSKSDSFSKIMLRASDVSSAGQQYFGAVTAISGGKILVSAINANLGGTNRGAVYLFDTAAISGTSANEQFKIEPPPGEEEDEAFFGSAIAISAENIFIASHLQNNVKGAVHVFDLLGSYLFTTRGEADGDMFGWSIEMISTSTFMVGAIYASNGNGATSGAVYEYSLVGSPATSSTLTQKITVDDGEDYMTFGSSIATTDNTIFVGAYNYTNGNFTGSGAVYVHSIAGAYLETILCPRAAIGDQFGWAVDATNTSLVVSAPGTTQSGKANSGVSYLFTQMEN